MCQCTCHKNCNCQQAGCPQQVKTDCIFYGMGSTTSSKLIAVQLPNGTGLTKILEEMDKLIKQLQVQVAELQSNN